MTMLPLRAGRTSAAPADLAKPAEPVWFNIDPETMPEDLALRYYAYRKALHAAEELRKEFESEANEAYDSGKGNMLKFGYKFGRCSAAIVPQRNAAGSKAIALSDLAKLR